MKLTTVKELIKELRTIEDLDTEIVVSYMTAGFAEHYAEKMGYVLRDKHAINEVLIDYMDAINKVVEDEFDKLHKTVQDSIVVWGEKDFGREI